MRVIAGKDLSLFKIEFRRRHQPIAPELAVQKMLGTRRAAVLGGIDVALLGDKIKILRDCDVQTATIDDFDSVFNLYKAACKPKSKNSGFLRNTYSENEIKELIDCGFVEVIKDSEQKVRAFAVIVPGDDPSLKMERLAVGFKIGKLFIQTCRWIDGKFITPDWKNIQYISLFAADPKVIIPEALLKNMLRELKQKDPKKDIFMTVSASPEPNIFMAESAKALSFRKVGYFRSPLGRPMAYVSGTKWIRNWQSDIYKFCDEDNFNK